MNAQTFIKANFLAGLFGSLVLSPLAYAYELAHQGPGSQLLKFSALDLVMFVVAPLIVAVTFAIVALAAFPIVSLLQRKGWLSFVAS